MIGHDPAPHREPEGNERWILLGAFVVALVALVAIVLEDYEPAKLAPVFLLLSWFPLIALHEAGHALVAKAVGWEVEEIVVGFGRPVAYLTLFGVETTIKMYPLGGYVRPVPTGLGAVRLKSALVYLAGPLFELLFVALLALVLGGSTLIAASDSVWVIACQGAAIAALLGAGLNLVPRAITTEHGPGLTDGMGALTSFTRPIRAFEAQIREGYERRIEAHAARGDREGAIAACVAAHAALGGDPHLLAVMGTALDALARDDRDAVLAAVTNAALPERLARRLSGPRA